MSTEIVQWDVLNADQQSKLLSRPTIASDREVREQAATIIERVRCDGDRALRELTLELDGAQPASLAVTDDEFQQAESALPAAALAAIDVAIANVRRFHEAQLPAPIDVTISPGIRCQRISQPIDAVGLYVPSGSAPLPSAAIMLSVPADIAACPAIVMCTPPRTDGSADPAVITAARRCGVRTIFKVGGAQAIAAMAYGTESIPKVAKVFGPGNAWVTAAKSLVACANGGAAIDMPAGPSELLIIADRYAEPSFVASDLLSQAEHGPDSQVILVTTSADLASRVQTEVATQLADLDRSAIARRALQHSRWLLVADLDTAVDVSNTYAPEHLILQVADPRALLSRVRNAGSVFLGPWAPESAGDYCSGTNHVLPTYGAARSYSGLGVDQFMRQMTVQELSIDGLRSIGPTIVELARLEGLGAHAAAIRIRLGDELETAT
jgi:histidinol dehydrogenase